MSRLCLATLWVFLLLVVPAQAIPPGWRDAPRIATGREFHTATLLTDGTVLVAGGFDANGDVLRSAERYFPAEGVWRSAGTMVTTRAEHVASSLDNGKVLVAGGLNENGQVGTAELYDPVSNTWSAVGALSMPRQFATAARLPTGKVLIAGGRFGEAAGAITDTTDLFDPVTNAFTPGPRMTVARVAPDAAPLPAGGVLIAGGSDAAGTVVASADVYHAGGTITPAASMAARRLGPTATTLLDGRVLVTGGSDDDGKALATAEVFDAATNKWTSTAPLQRTADYHTATRLTNGKVLVAGGYSEDAQQTALLYDPAANAWAPVGVARAARAAHTATLLPNGSVFTSGGFGYTDGKRVIWLLSELWTPTTTVRADGAFVFSERAPGSVGTGEVRVTNTGDVPMLASGFTLGGASAGVYGIVSDGCSGVAVAPGASCAIGLRFAPPGAGEHNATLTFDANSAVQTHGIALYGRGVVPVVRATGPAKNPATLAYKYSGVTRKSTKISGLIVKNVPAGATVRVACKKGCLLKGRIRRDSKGEVKLAKVVAQRLKAGSVLTVTVSKPGSITVIKTLTIRKRKAPVLTTKCREPGGRTTAC